VRATAAASDRTVRCERIVGRTMAAALPATVIRLLHPLVFADTKDGASVRPPGHRPHRPAGSLIEGGRVILFVPKVVGQTRARKLFGEGLD
jgi:hypothetical protein